MGEVTTNLRSAAVTARNMAANSMQQTGTLGCELHYGAWIVHCDGKWNDKPTIAHYVHPKKQELINQLNKSRNKNIKHVEDDFLIDVIGIFQRTGASPLWMAPTIKKDLKINFWLFYSPCPTCLENIAKFFMNKNSYGKNKAGRCWLKMTFEEYWHGWRSENEAQQAYDTFSANYNGQIVIKKHNIVD